MEQVKVILESTDQMVFVENREGDCKCAVPGRIWEGHTETGIYVQAVITRIATPAGPSEERFRRELTECRPPFRSDIFPARLVI